MTPKSEPTPVLYLEDLAPGQKFTSGSCTITEPEIIAFAAQYDPQPFHLDPAAAQASVFRGLAASGWQTAAIAMRLLIEGDLRLAGGIVGLGGDLAWPRPTRPGDTITVESEILEVIPSRSKPAQGVATVRSTAYNQNREPVYILNAKLLVHRRPV